MTTSLPKLKIFTDNSEAGSQKQIKFKKLKLNTDESATDIRQRFKSVRTERLSSLERYSTVQGQRQYKKQKIHLNLLQRKLLSGTYDQAKQTGSDLNSLKQKTDFYKTSAIQKQVQIQKINQLIIDIKKQIQKYDIEKRKKQEVVTKVQKKFEQQKVKTESLILQKHSLQHMIASRKEINIYFENKRNESKVYLAKLKSVLKQVQNQARQSNENMKNLISKVGRISNQVLRQQRSRQQIMYQKQYVINKRKEDQKQRLQKSQQYKKSLDQVQEEIQKKDFMDVYKGILANLFISKYSQLTMEDLQYKYQIMQNMYKKICTYNKFNSQQPQKMVERNRQLDPQAKQYDQRIKNLQKKQAQLQKKNQQLLQKYQASLLTSRQQEMINGNNRTKSPSRNLQIQQRKLEQKQQERKRQRILNQVSHANQVYFKLQKWTERYGKHYDLKIKRNSSAQQISRNMQAILSIINEDVKFVQANMNKTIK